VWDAVDAAGAVSLRRMCGDVWRAVHGCAEDLCMTARVWEKMSGRQSVPSVAWGIGKPEVTSWFLFRES
jgi:hypothetical protein